MGFEFNALSDEIRSLRQEIAALKRFATSGNVQDIELVMRTSGGGPMLFDGPTVHGLHTSVARFNQWVNLQFVGVTTDVSSASGSLYLDLPWPVVPVHSVQHTPVGEFDCTTGAGNLPGTLYVPPGPPGPTLQLYYRTTSNALAQVTTSAPATWTVGCAIRGNIAARIAPGY